MTAKEKTFFRQMRNTVIRAVREQGVGNIKSIRVTENGITIDTSGGTHTQKER